MSVVMILWLAFCLLVGLMWTLRHSELNRAARDVHRLCEDSHPPLGNQAPMLSVLVAAKDEEANIAACVRTLLDQDYPNYEVIAVNDRSGDDTGPILDSLRADYPDRLQVIHVTDLPDGWFGKNNAMRRGVEIARGDWLCFVDADCRQTSRATLSMAMREAEAQGADFLSLLPVLETRSFWEKVIQPACAAIMIIWFNPRLVNDPDSTAAYANGAFMLMSRDLYHAIGGHERVKTELNEDMHMAQLTKSIGRRLFVVENDGLYLTRMYSSFREAWRGWSRIFYGCFKTYRRLAATLGLVTVASVFPFVSLMVAALGYVLADGEAARPWGWAFAITGCVFVMLESVIYRLLKMMRAAPWAWMTYPIGAILGTGMVLAAIRKVGGAATTTWRGTTYRGDTRADAPAPPALPADEKPAEASVDIA